PDLRRAGDGAAGKRRSEEVERVTSRFELAGDRADEVLDGGGSLEATQAWDANGARLADPAEVVPEDVHDHRVLGSVLLGLEQLAGEPPIVGPIAAPRPGALDR